MGKRAALQPKIDFGIGKRSAFQYQKVDFEIGKRSAAKTRRKRTIWSELDNWKVNRNQAAAVQTGLRADKPQLNNWRPNRNKTKRIPDSTHAWFASVTKEKMKEPKLKKQSSHTARPCHWKKRALVHPDRRRRVAPPHFFWNLVPVGRIRRVKSRTLGRYCSSRGRRIVLYCLLAFSCFHGLWIGWYLFYLFFTSFHFLKLFAIDFEWVQLRLNCVSIYLQLFALGSIVACLISIDLFYFISG